MCSQRVETEKVHMGWAHVTSGNAADADTSQCRIVYLPYGEASCCVLIHTQRGALGEMLCGPGWGDSLTDGWLSV